MPKKNSTKNVINNKTKSIPTANLNLKNTSNDVFLVNLFHHPGCSTLAVWRFAGMGNPLVVEGGQREEEQSVYGEYQQRVTVSDVRDRQRRSKLYKLNFFKN